LLNILRLVNAIGRRVLHFARTQSSELVDLVVAHLLVVEDRPLPAAHVRDGEIVVPEVRGRTERDGRRQRGQVRAKGGGVVPNLT
jgi:hypothetical protein